MLTVKGDVPVDRAPKPEPGQKGDKTPSTPETPAPKPSDPSKPGDPSTPAKPLPTTLRGSDRYETNVASIRAAFTSATTVLLQAVRTLQMRYLQALQP